MDHPDQIRWDRKYSEKKPHSEITPDTFLARHLTGISPGIALDIGCGFGDNAITLAREGFQVTGLDISRVALDRAKERARYAGVDVEFVWSDVEDFDFGDQTYDLVTGFYFLNRPIFPRIKKGLRIGAIFLYKTYTEGELFYRPSLNRDYLLEQGELKRSFEEFEILLYDERDNGKECTAKIIARK
jgi:SAM-dependent methyltransferase